MPKKTPKPRAPEDTPASFPRLSPRGAESGGRFPAWAARLQVVVPAGAFARAVPPFLFLESPR